MERITCKYFYYFSHQIYNDIAKAAKGYLFADWIAGPTRGMGPLIDQLEQFGFSQTEAETYRAVLELGQGTVGEVATAADLSKGYAYEVIGDLQERGVVTVDDHLTPTQVRAQQPEETVRDLAAGLDRLESSLRTHYSHTDPDHPEVEVVKSRQPAGRRLRRAIDAAETELYLSVPYPALERVVDALEAAVGRGVFVLLLLSDCGPASVTDGVEGRVTAARRCPCDIPFVTMTDGGTAMVGDAGVLYGEHDRSEFALLVRNSPKLSGAIGALFTNFWMSTSDAYVAPPDDLPATYDSFSEAVFQTTLHLRGGSDLYATAELLSGATIEGHVVDVEQSLLGPMTAQFPLQNTIVLSTADGTVSVGGPGAFVEEYSAGVVRLRRADDN
ncbi:hypothetical protein GCM10009030_32070 [Haloarcula pellucida]|uniref:TrmB family transcriptional regulator n=2 Tax=Haloarcula pellucida TaxID=1427151 RepID=A0A830GND2_9EURY|nr:TrmB family transcriptional regulator sugar-binding domain-containing protein [Halomicroarcula sp. S1AR25-4]GGN99934.1 hypothetical protein GCM10009030_32070 [Halomicroarcula pellucida]